MKNNNQHIIFDDLLAFNNGRLDLQKANQCIKHLESCEECQNTLEAIQEFNSTELRQPHIEYAEKQLDERLSDISKQHIRKSQKSNYIRRLKNHFYKNSWIYLNVVAASLLLIVITKFVLHSEYIDEIPVSEGGKREVESSEDNPPLMESSHLNKNSIKSPTNSILERSDTVSREFNHTTPSDMKDKYMHLDSFRNNDIDKTLAEADMSKQTPSSAVSNEPIPQKLPLSPSRSLIKESPTNSILERSDTVSREFNHTTPSDMKDKYMHLDSFRNNDIDKTLAEADMPKQTPSSAVSNTLVRQKLPLFSPHSPIKKRQVVGMSVATTNNQYYIWYSDGTMSMSSTPDADTRSPLYKYSLPRGKSVNSIVSIGIDADGRVYTWYNDGTVSGGTVFELGAHQTPYRYSLPRGKSVNNIVGMGISTNNHVYTWYKDGTMSVGTPYELARHNVPYQYAFPQRKSTNNLVGVNISHNNDYVYAWYRGTKSDIFDYRHNSISDDYYGHNNMSFDVAENLQFNVSNVRNINSIVSDFAPSFYKNQLMFSTFRRGNGNNNDNSNQVYISMRSGAKLSRPEPLRKGYRAAISSESDPSFTEDGTRVAYVRNKNFDNGTLPQMGNSAKLDIYLADAVSQNDWQNKKAFPYNSRKYSTGYPHLSSNGDVLYFASNMLGGYGGFDIYECERIGNSWSKPINLGPEINSSDDEISPFLADNTLYFASDTYGGYGGFDIYKSVYSDKEWQQADNMGEGINSFHDDYDFIYEPYEKIAYFTSNRPDGLGGDDIYQAKGEILIAEPETMSAPSPRPVPRPSLVNTSARMVVIVSDEKTKQPLGNVHIETTCDRRIYVTDVGGLAVLEQFDRDCSIRISKSGYGTSMHRFPTAKQVGVELVPIDQTPTIVYPRTAVSAPDRVVLVVRDRQTKRPINGVKIDLSICNGEIYTTGADGLVILERFDDNCVIRIIKSGYENNLRHFPTMAQLGVELKQLEEGYTSLVMELEPDKKLDNSFANSTDAKTTDTIYTSNDMVNRRPSYSYYATYVSTSLVEDNNNRDVYEVQIGAYHRPHPEFYQSFKNLGMVYFDMKNDMMVYKVGSFTNYNDAERVRKIIRNNGHPDAFIKKTSRPVPAASMQFTSASANNIVYKIQLGVFRNPDNAVFNAQLENFGRIQQSTRADGLTVFFLGNFYSMSEATTAQENAINLGVSKAFIVKYRNGVKVEL